jgi:hypothetical protein
MSSKKDKPQQQPTTTTTPSERRVPLEAMTAEGGAMTQDALEWMERLAKMNAKALDVLEPADVVNSAMGAAVTLALGFIPRPLAREVAPRHRRRDGRRNRPPRAARQLR